MLNKVEFAMTVDGATVIQPQTVVLTRNYAYSVSNAVANEEQEDTLNKVLAKDVSQFIIFRRALSWMADHLSGRFAHQRLILRRRAADSKPASKWVRGSRDARHPRRPLPGRWRLRSIAATSHLPLSRSMEQRAAGANDWY